VGATAFLAGCRSATPAQPGAAAPGGAGSSPAASSLGLFQVAEGKRGGTITDMATEPTTGFDPHATSASQSNQVFEAMHIKLIRHDYRKGYKTGADALIGELAAKWESPDPLTYNFVLRKGVNWPDQEPMKGRPITAQDVKYSFDHALLPTSQVQEYVYGNIASVTAVDDGSLTIKLKQPNLFFPSDVDSLNSMILPKGIYEWAGGDIKGADKVRGGGPWMLEEYRANSVIRFTANETYRKVFGVPYFDRLNMAIIATGAPRLQAFVAKNTDFFNPAAGQLESAKKARPDARVVDDAFPASGGTSVSINRKEKPFDDLRVRRAMSMAIDREGWGKALQVPYKWECGPISWGYPEWKVDPAQMPAEVAKWLKSDVAEAKKLMDAAGYKSNAEIPLNYYPYSPDYTPLGQFIIDSFGKIGLNLKPRIHEYNNWLATVFIGKYNGLMHNPDSSIDRPSPQFADRLRKGSARNHSFIEDDETQKLLKDFWGARSIEEAKAVGVKIQTRSVDDVFSVYGPMGVAPHFWDPSVQNYEGQWAFNHQYAYKDAYYWRT